MSSWAGYPTHNVETVFGLGGPTNRVNGDLYQDPSRLKGAYAVHAAGAWVPGDGGGGHFLWSAASITDDGGVNLVPGGSTSGRTGPGWVRQTHQDGEISVRWFGARGDAKSVGGYNILTGNNDAPAIQAAIDYAWSLVDGGTVYFPTGKYRLFQTLTIPTDQNIGKVIGLRGDGPTGVGGNSDSGLAGGVSALVTWVGDPLPDDSPLIEFIKAGSAYAESCYGFSMENLAFYRFRGTMFRYAADPALIVTTRFFRPNIRNCSFRTHPGIPYSGPLVDMNAVLYGHFDNLTASGGSPNFKFSNASNFTITEMSSKHPGSGGLLWLNSVGQVVISHIRPDKGTAYGIKLERASNTTVIGFSSEGNAEPKLVWVKDSDGVVMINPVIANIDVNIHAPAYGLYLEGATDFKLINGIIQKTSINAGDRAVYVDANCKNVDIDAQIAQVDDGIYVDPGAVDVRIAARSTLGNAGRLFGSVMGFAIGPYSTAGGISLPYVTILYGSNRTYYWAPDGDFGTQNLYPPMDGREVEIIAGNANVVLEDTTTGGHGGNMLLKNGVAWHMGTLDAIRLVYVGAIGKWVEMGRKQA